MNVTRRQVAALAACAGLPNVAFAQGRGGARAHVSPGGAGDRSGRNRENASPLDALDALVRRVGPGGEIVLEAGAYEGAEMIALTAGGAPGRPVVIRAASPGQAVLVGARSEIFSPEAPKGRESLRLLSGADHLRFVGLAFRNIGNGCFRIGAPIAGLEIEACRFFNVYRFIENTASGRGDDASLTGFRIADCEGARIERSFLRLRYASAQGRIEDCRADGEGVEGDPFAVGCSLSGATRDVRFRRCVMENFRQNNGARYWNGDGFADERGCADIVYEDCRASGCTDGGFDCKSANVRLIRCTADDNKRNFRIWSTAAQLENCVSTGPRKRSGEGEDPGAPAHLWVGGGGPHDLTIEGFSARGGSETAPLVLVEAQTARIRFADLRADVPEGAPRVRVREGADVVVTRDGAPFGVDAAASAP